MKALPLFALGGILLAGTVAAAGPAHAGKPMNVAEKQAAAQAMARAHMQGKAAKRVMRKDDTGSEVPEDLHNYLHAQVDAKGNVRIVETDGPTAPAKTQEASDE